jgi:guanylate kinase
MVDEQTMRTDLRERLDGAVGTASTGSGARGVVSDQFGEHADDLIGDLRALRRPRLFIISGPSGVGKDTVIEVLRQRYPEAYFAVTATTRDRRPGEIDGYHYYFMDAAAFAEHKRDGEFLESAVVYGFHYGVPRGPIRAALARGQDVFIKVDVQGAESIRALAPLAISIFLAPESMTSLLHRLRSRKTEDADVLMRRFGTASREMTKASEFDYVIFNESDRVEQTVDQICAIVVAERCRTTQPEIHI